MEQDFKTAFVYIREALAGTLKKALIRLIEERIRNLM